MFPSNGGSSSGAVSSSAHKHLIAEGWIDQIQQRAIRGEPVQILHEQLACLVHVTTICAGNVRRQDDIFEIPKWAVGFERFMLEDVEARAANLSRGQRRSHRGLVDHFAAPDIYQVSAGFHRREFPLADE